MDNRTLVVQQARIAAFLTLMWTAAGSFAVSEDEEIRIKCEFQQRLTWQKFVNALIFFSLRYAKHSGRSFVFLFLPVGWVLFSLS